MQEEVPPHEHLVTSEVGILVVDEKERSKCIWRNATICLVISLLASPLPTFAIGFIIGFAFTGFAVFHAWVSKCRTRRIFF